MAKQPRLQMGQAKNFVDPNRLSPMFDRLGRVQCFGLPKMADVPIYTITHTHIHTFNSPFSGTTQVSRYQKGKTNLNFTEARDSEWQWHQLGHMQICTSLQTDNHASTPPLSFLQAGCPSCHPTNSVKALKAKPIYTISPLIIGNLSIGKPAHSD